MIPAELHTEKGLRYFKYGFEWSMIFYGIIAILFIGAMVAMQFTDTGGSTGIIGIWTPFMWFSFGILFAYLILFIALIFFFLGLLSMSNGRWEFGFHHANLFQKGMIFLLIGFVISMFGGMGFGMMGSFVGVITSILISFGLYYLIQGIVDEKARRLLWTGVIFYIIIGITSAVASLLLWFMIFSPFGGFDGFWLMTMIPLGIGTFNIIPLWMFHTVYKRTYLRVKNREIQPVPIPPPMMMPYPMAYPPYYPGYPPQNPQPPGTQPANIGIKPVQQIGIKPQGNVYQVPQETVRCSSCGTTIPKGSSFCLACGKEQ